MTQGSSLLLREDAMRQKSFPCTRQLFKNCSISCRLHSSDLVSFTLPTSQKTGKQAPGFSLFWRPYCRDTPHQPSLVFFQVLSEAVSPLHFYNLSESYFACFTGQQKERLLEAWFEYSCLYLGPSEPALSDSLRNSVNACYPYFLISYSSTYFCYFLRRRRHSQYSVVYSSTFCFSSFLYPFMRSWRCVTMEGSALNILTRSYNRCYYCSADLWKSQKNRFQSSYFSREVGRKPLSFSDSGSRGIATMCDEEGGMSQV